MLNSRASVSEYGASKRTEGRAAVPTSTPEASGSFAQSFGGQYCQKRDCKEQVRDTDANL